MKVLAIIPARGGSKGIHRKNLVDVGGKPLIGWSINTALELSNKGLIDHFIVSTDDEEIACVAKRYGAEVPFLRPAELSSDTAKAIEYVIHAINFFKETGIDFDAVLLLQPTSPIRDVEAIAKALKEFKECSSDSLISCYKEDYVNDLVMYIRSAEGTLTPKSSDHNKGIRRQDHGGIWIRNGSIYITKTSYIIEHNRLICDKPHLLEMSKSDSMNLDTPEDLITLRALICAREY